MDINVLTQTLLRTAAEIMVCDGWDQPDYLFALRGPEHDPELEYVVQVPTSAAEFLPTILELGMTMHPDVMAVVLVTTACDDLAFEEALELPLLGSMRKLADEAGISGAAIGGHLRDIWELLVGQEHKSEDLVRPVRALVGVLRNGVTAVVVHEKGGPVGRCDRLPRLYGDHDIVVDLVLRLMQAETCMPRRQVELAVSA